MPLHHAALGVLDPLALGVVDIGVDVIIGAERWLRFATNVDAHAGEAGGEAGILALFADGQAELMVGHDDVGLGEVVADDDLFHPRR